MLDARETMIVAIVQARISSARLPGKTLLPVLGRPLLARQLERIRRARRIDSFLVATSAQASDDPIQRLCEQEGIVCHRGSLDDVLDRYYSAARAASAQTIVRLTGDCPLIDPAVLDYVIERYYAARADYASNTMEPTYPDGLDVEVFSYSALETTWREALLPSEREHVTPFLYKHPERFRLVSVRQAQNQSTLRWTVDNPEDYQLVCRIYEALYPAMPDFSMQNVLDLFKLDPGLVEINKHLSRNEGYQRSLAGDASLRSENGVN